MSHRNRISWRERIYHASRSQGFLWKFAIGTLGLGVFTGILLSRIEPSGPGNLGDRVLAAAALRDQAEEDEVELPESAPQLLAALEAELKEPSVEFQHLVRAIPTIAPILGQGHGEEIHRIFRARFPEAQAVLAADYLAAWTDRSGNAFRRIEAAATAAPQRYAHYILGRLEMKRRNYRAAYEQFRREAGAGDAPESRYMAVQALSRTEDFEALARLEAEPAYAPYFDARARLEMAIKRKDWRGILKWVPVSQWDSNWQGTFLVSLVAGLAWGLFLLNLGEVPRFFSSRTMLCLAGLVAGAASTTVTIYLIVLQEDILNFHKGEALAQTLPYYIAGVGLREELSKLLLFVPFLPFLLKRESELEAVLVASFVGLGFAVEENGGYFMLSEAAGAPGRFLTANFYHVALTGMNGLALYRACHRHHRSRGGFTQFMTILPLTIVLHGAYDALLGADEIELAGFLAMVIYVAFCQYYFRSLHPLRDNGRRTVSLTGSFVFGISVLGATVIAYQMATLGASAGAQLIFSELLGSVVLLFLFFREMNEPLSA